MKIAIFGAEGQLGQDIRIALSAHQLKVLPHSQVDIADGEAVHASLAKLRPAWVVNAAAMTNVDRCETEKDRAFAINADGAGNVAEACSRAGARLVHISTDYVFDGNKRKPYVEDDETNPLNVYGRSKLAGETVVEAAVEQHYIVRSSGLYGTHPCRGKGGANFVETMLRLAAGRPELSVVTDEVLTPTYTVDLAAALARIIENEPPFGVYHATNDGECSWFDFAEEIFRAAGVGVNLKKTTAAAWGAPAKRPAYSVLENKALQKTELDHMPHWKDALGRYLASRP